MTMIIPLLFDFGVEKKYNRDSPVEECDATMLNGSSLAGPKKYVNALRAKGCFASYFY
jgi:hypothetical protein